VRPLIVARGLVLAGVVVLGAGVAMLVLPGPGVMVATTGAALVLAGLLTRAAIR
jgi:hypothetical protein